MKKRIIAASIALIVTGSAATTVFALNQSNKEVSQVTTPEAPQEPLKKETPKVSPAKVKPVQNAPQTVQEPEEEIIPTNAALIAQYGWVNNPFKDSINFIMKYYPQFFTEDERVYTFGWLNNVCNNIMVDFGTGVKEKTNLTYCYVRLMGKDGSIADWIRLGKQAGVDTSHYE